MRVSREALREQFLRLLVAQGGDGAESQLVQAGAELGDAQDGLRRLGTQLDAVGVQTLEARRELQRADERDQVARGEVREVVQGESPDAVSVVRVLQVPGDLVVEWNVQVVAQQRVQL